LDNNRNNYDDSQIQVLEGLEAVRKRPGMYIGSTSERGLHHLVYEIVDNAIDEALAGYCRNIEVTLLPDGSVRISDDGRGIPTGTHATGKSALEVVFTILHAGGKFGGGGYKVSGGLHGVGASVVNALSEWLCVDVHDGAKIHHMSFERGNVTEPITVTGTTDRTGTTIRFKPDAKIFEVLHFNYETLLNRLREQAFLNAGVAITITDEREEEPIGERLCYEGGIRSFVEYINRNKQPIHEQVIYLTGSKGTSIAEVALQYNDSYNENILSFANDIATTEGGMHETGFKASLTKVLNEYARKANILKESDDALKGEDVREGLVAVISVKLEEAQFEGQTKTKLGNSDIRTLVETMMNDKLATFFDEKAANEVMEEIESLGIDAYVVGKTLYVLIERDKDDPHYVDDIVYRCKELAYEYISTHKDSEQMEMLREELMK
jgi:DNA gyrase subunit B